jgi:CheY-like chemotaxis protein
MSENRNATLLVLDDEPLIVRLIVRSFRDEFNEIIISTTPEEAEEMLQQHTVTHVICDAYPGPDPPHGISLFQK